MSSGPSNAAYRYALAFFLIFTAYFWYIFHSIGAFLAQHYIPEGSRFSVSHPDFNMTNNIAATVLALVVLFILFSSDKLKEHVVDVGDELSHVSWANLTDTRKATLIVLGLVLVSSLVLFLFDMFFLRVVNAVLETAF